MATISNGNAARLICYLAVSGDITLLGHAAKTLVTSLKHASK